MTMNNELTLLLMCIALLVGIILGAFIENKTTEPCMCQSLQGLWTSNACEFEGQWVHVRVDNVNITDALINVQHEVGHEIFARKCSENMTPCMEVMKE